MGQLCPPLLWLREIVIPQGSPGASPLDPGIEEGLGRVIVVSVGIFDFSLSLLCVVGHGVPIVGLQEKVGFR